VSLIFLRIKFVAKARVSPIDPIPMGVKTKRGMNKESTVLTHGFTDANPMPIKSPHGPSRPMGATIRERVGQRCPQLSYPKGKLRSLLG